MPFERGILFTETIVTKRIYIATWVGAAVMLCFSVGAVAQNSKSEQGSQAQSQSAQQQWLQSNKQSTDQHATDQATGRDKTKLVGGKARQHLLAAQLPSQVLASSLIGMTVRNKAESIGTVRDLIMNEDYDLMGLVVDMSGATGLIDKSVGIAWDAVKDIDLKEGVIMVAVKKSKLQTIESYTTQEELQ